MKLFYTALALAIPISIFAQTPGEDTATPPANTNTENTDTTFPGTTTPGRTTTPQTPPSETTKGQRILEQTVQVLQGLLHQEAHKKRLLQPLKHKEQPVHPNIRMP